MRRFVRWIARFLLFLLVAAGALWLLGPREPVDDVVSFAATLGADTLDAHFAQAEARFGDITPGAEKRVIWAEGQGVQTPISVLYLHGFSATSEEIRPVPDNVARALGANLVFTRLAGHGRGDKALAEATAGDWIEDTAEALAAARAAGQEVIVLATSTGGTLAALAALDPALSERVKGVVFVSPNFGIAKPAARILTWPAARFWVPIVAGRSRSMDVRNADHGTFWTTRYPTVAVLPMAALVQHAMAQDMADATLPALFLYSPKDSVVDPAMTRAVAAHWGGPAVLSPQQLPPGGDPYNHVIAGDIMSPGMTQTLSAQIIAWAKGL